MHLGWGSARLCPQLLSSNVVNDLMLLESLLDNLMAQQKDTSARVRRLVLRGLANVALGSPDKVTVGQPSGALLLGKGGRAEPQLVRRPGETQQSQARRVGSWAWHGLGTQVCMASPGTDPRPPTPDCHDWWAGRRGRPDRKSVV